jgi:tyrosyl-tRNA synthetase
MKTNFVEELRWRGLLHDIMPETEELLNKEQVVGYIGFDPTSDSLHIGSLSQILTLMRFQRAGHVPVALVGGATGMIGDPSGKTAERSLLDEAQLQKNVDGIRAQLERFLDFSDAATGAKLVNNYEWMKDYSFIAFVRDIGKHLTVNYMMAKDSVKNRLETGMSFTEFSYQLLQGFDFYHLNTTMNCKLQMGGSDQWGNITSGTELIRRKSGKEAFALTTQLIKKADGTKFGKSEGGNIWLDRTKTSPYKFYQYWINTSDEDAENFIKYFTFMPKEETEQLIEKHRTDKGARLLQKRLAEEVTVLVHGREDYEAALAASEVLFRGGLADLAAMNEQLFLEVFEGVPSFEISRTHLSSGANIIDLLATHTTILPSKGEARKLIQAGGVSVNKEKVESIEKVYTTDALIKEKYLLIQRGKKLYYLCYIQ